MNAPTGSGPPADAHPRSDLALAPRPYSRPPNDAAYGAPPTTLLDTLAPARGIVLAVSGGPDSTALMHLAATWRAEGMRPPIAVATVDHGLRPESRAEADHVVTTARDLGFPARRLAWAGDNQGRGLQARARAARYALLTDFARDLGASHVVTAHTSDDQAETVLMRLASGSGVGGLGAMRAAADLRGLVLARPLLGVPKRDLEALCVANGWSFVEDPSNADPVYARTRWRKLADALAAEGLTAKRLTSLAERMARAEAALTQAAEAAARRTAIEGRTPERRFDMPALAREPDELAIRVIGAALVEVSGRRQPRLERLERLAAEVQTAFAAGQGLQRTLHHCLVSLSGATLVIGPEPLRSRGVGTVALQYDSSFSVAPEAPWGGSLGKGSPASYIDDVDATARTPDVVETHSASGASAREPMLSAGPQ